ncbi:MAG TPA: hypothetical protein VHM31_09405 [Polyangia bacterium]|nr:hypothetical protein [Polyangia bacterium]
MTQRDQPPLDPELESLVRPPKIARHAPAEVRARALVRARAIVGAGGVKPAAWPADPPAPVSVSLARGRGRVRLAFAAAAGVVAVAVGAIASLRGPRPEPAAVDPVPTPSRVASRETPTELAPPSEAEALPPAPPHRLPRLRSRSSSRVAAAGDRFTGELELLQRAQAAYTRREFSGALALLAEHARRFPRGHLAEERDALRVRSLLGAGRTDEAHRAAVVFRVRFPRSVLLPRVDSAESQ